MKYMIIGYTTVMILHIPFHGHKPEWWVIHILGLSILFLIWYIVSRHEIKAARKK
jgi:hypothetical protein